MSRTRKTKVAHYLGLLLTGALLGVATVQGNPARGRHNGKIVFISNRNYKGLSVWTMNSDGSSPTRLTDDASRTERLPSFSPVYDSHPVWSPDGTKIAFISNRNSRSALYVMNADGSNARLVMDKVIDAGEPAWSPNGGKIAFSGGARGSIGSHIPSVNIYVVKLDGSELTQLTRDSGMNGNPSWSPDGKQIVFSSSRDSVARLKIWVMNADGSNQRILPNPQNTTGTGFLGNQPVWSPDGTKILAGFTPERKGTLEPLPEIVIMNTDGSDQINILNRGRYTNSSQSFLTDVHADWQPLLAPPKI